MHTCPQNEALKQTTRELEEAGGAKRFEILGAKAEKDKLEGQVVQVRR